MTSSLGTWSNAPLAYVLAEVRTELVSNIRDYQAKIGGLLREEYPLQRQMHATRLVATGNQLVVETGSWLLVHRQTMSSKPQNLGQRSSDRPCHRDATDGICA